MTKNRFSAAILNFYDQTGSRFFQKIFFTNHYCRTWKIAIKILKISQLVLVLSTKNRFSAAILNFYDQTGSRFFNQFFFTNHCYWTWKFAIRILKISQLNLDYLMKNRFSAAILNFYDQSGSKFLTQYFLRITTIEPENLPFEFWKYLYKFSFYWRKTGLRQPFWIFTTKPEVNFLTQYFLRITTIEPENLPLQFWVWNLK